MNVVPRLRFHKPLGSHLDLGRVWPHEVCVGLPRPVEADPSVSLQTVIDTLVWGLPPGFPRLAT